MVQKVSKIPRPKSSVPFLSGIIAIVYILIGFHLWPAAFTEYSPHVSAIVFLVYLFLFVAVYEIIFVKIYRDKETGLDFKQRRPISSLTENKNFLYKLAGLVIPYALVLVCYWQFLFYRSEMYDPFFDALRDCGPFIILGLLIYFPIIHLYMVNPNDSYWNMGLYLLSFGKRGDKDLAKNHALAVVIKGFFAPLMFCYFIINWDNLVGYELVSEEGLQAIVFIFNRDNLFESELIFNVGFQPIFDYLIHYIFFIDLSIATVGYAFTTRILNSHVRWPEMKAGGWLFCLLCYAPFWQITGHYYLNYTQESPDWIDVFQENEVIFVMWGSAILILTAMFSLCTAHFGVRFSNLTHRGIITHGLYRFTKHPAYIVKCVSWWMISLPFISASLTFAISNCIALILLNFIYYKRAKYEEACLSQDIVYKKYMEYIAENGLFARFFNMFGKKMKKT